MRNFSITHLLFKLKCFRSIIISWYYSYTMLLCVCSSSAAFFVSLPTHSKSQYRVLEFVNRFSFILRGLLPYPVLLHDLEKGLGDFFYKILITNTKDRFSKCSIPLKGTIAPNLFLIANLLKLFIFILGNSVCSLNHHHYEKLYCDLLKSISFIC
ncbi:hypothetical protein SAMN04489864_101150 [Pedobacter insulae]|uniref:Uncharacterized protein n=1 Tax=Pedobacter insulae TaxID=414048 RepID=A0A1I2T0R7_9SPHI|nr:hypothetical protein SAMN04489864_101150 [Pedobacter insulae]